MLATLFIHLHLRGCSSLKEKRGILKSFMARLRKEYNVAVAEIDRQDMWQEAVLGCALIANQRLILETSLESVMAWVEANWRMAKLLNNGWNLFHNFCHINNRKITHFTALKVKYGMKNWQRKQRSVYGSQTE